MIPQAPLLLVIALAIAVAYVAGGAWFLFDALLKRWEERRRHRWVWENFDQDAAAEALMALDEEPALLDRGVA